MHFFSSDGHIAFPVLGYITWMDVSRHQVLQMHFPQENQDSNGLVTYSSSFKCFSDVCILKLAIEISL